MDSGPSTRPRGIAPQPASAPSPHPDWIDLDSCSTSKQRCRESNRPVASCPSTKPKQHPLTQPPKSVSLSANLETTRYDPRILPSVLPVSTLLTNGITVMLLVPREGHGRWNVLKGIPTQEPERSRAVGDCSQPRLFSRKNFNDD